MAFKKQLNSGKGNNASRMPLEVILPNGDFGCKLLRLRKLSQKMTEVTSSLYVQQTHLPSLYVQQTHIPSQIITKYYLIKLYPIYF